MRRRRCCATCAARGVPIEHLDVGHSPLGSLSVFALLALLAVQVGSGLFADDEISNTGPLNRLVSDDRAAVLTGWHAGLRPLADRSRWCVLHIAAIAYYALLPQAPAGAAR